MEIVYRRCSVCGKSKISSKFYHDHRCRSGLRSECKDCTKKASGKRYQARKKLLTDWQNISEHLDLNTKKNFQLIYGQATVKYRGKIVMKEGKVLDIEWYKKKLIKFEKSQ